MTPARSSRGLCDSGASFGGQLGRSRFAARGAPACDLLVTFGGGKCSVTVRTADPAGHLLVIHLGDRVGNRTLTQTAGRLAATDRTLAEPNLRGVARGFGFLEQRENLVVGDGRVGLGAHGGHPLRCGAVRGRHVERIHANSQAVK